MRGCGWIINGFEILFDAEDYISQIQQLWAAICVVVIISLLVIPETFPNNCLLSTHPTVINEEFTSTILVAYTTTISWWLWVVQMKFIVDLCPFELTHKLHYNAFQLSDFPTCPVTMIHRRLWTLRRFISRRTLLFLLTVHRAEPEVLRGAACP